MSVRTVYDMGDDAEWYNVIKSFFFSIAALRNHKLCIFHYLQGSD